MKRIICPIIFFLTLFLTLTKSALAMPITLIAGTSAAIKTETISDERIVKLKQFLNSYNSPLAKYAEVFVEKADQYGLPDWKLVPAITGVESTFGKAIPFNSYNAYGWCNGAYSFKDWEDSIDIVTKTLKFKYYDKGLNSVEKISHVYAPPSNTWAFKVNYFMSELEMYIPHQLDDLAVTI